MVIRAISQLCQTKIDNRFSNPLFMPGVIWNGFCFFVEAIGDFFWKKLHWLEATSNWKTSMILFDSCSSAGAWETRTCSFNVLAPLLSMNWCALFKDGSKTIIWNKKLLIKCMVSWNRVVSRHQWGLIGSQALGDMCRLNSHGLESKYKILNFVSRMALKWS